MMNLPEDSRSLHISSIPSKEIIHLETDYALFDLLKAGQDDVMVCLFDRYSQLVYATALRVLHDRAAAEDVMQELFMQLWRKPPAVPAGHGSLAGWFVLIARNRAIGALRKRRSTCPIEDVFIASPYNLFDEAEKSCLLERLRTAITDFPMEQRIVLDLAFFDGLTHEEIAATTGHALGTVKSRIRKALVLLRKQFPGESTRTASKTDLPRIA